MTREEAIEKLELLRQKVDEDTYRALIMGIKALEQEPCDDAISREAVLKRIAQFSVEEGSSVRCQPLYSDVNNMPSVQPSRKGQWIKERPWLKVHCSECGKDAIGNHGFDALKTYFCPYCGADMRGDTDDNAG